MADKGFVNIWALLAAEPTGKERVKPSGDGLCSEKHAVSGIQCVVCVGVTSLEDF